MAVTSVTKNTKARVILDGGTDASTGKAITKSQYITGLRSNPDGARIYDVVDLLAPCIAYPVEGVETIETKILEKV